MSNRPPGSSPKNAPYSQEARQKLQTTPVSTAQRPNINLPQALRIADHLRPNKAIRKRELQNAGQTTARRHDESHRAFNHRQPREPSAARSVDRSFSSSFRTHKLRWHASRCNRSIGVHSDAGSSTSRSFFGSPRRDPARNLSTEDRCCTGSLSARGSANASANAADKLPHRRHTNSFTPQRAHGIDSRGAPGGKQAGQGCHKQQQNRDCEENERAR